MLNKSPSISELQFIMTYTYSIIQNTSNSKSPASNAISTYLRISVFCQVFKHDNPLERDMNDRGVSVELRLNASSLKNASDFTGRRRLPNPLYHGNLIDTEHKWTNFEPMEESGRFPLRNLAILFLEEPLHPYQMNINYPVIEMDPGKFTRKNVQADMFGWCQYGHGTTPKTSPRLTKTTVEVTYCEEGSNKYVTVRETAVF